MRGIESYLYVKYALTGHRGQERDRLKRDFLEIDR